MYRLADFLLDRGPLPLRNFDRQWLICFQQVLSKSADRKKPIWARLAWDVLTPVSGGVFQVVKTAQSRGRTGRTLLTR
jgi:hypothetical protein